MVLANVYSAYSFVGNNLITIMALKNPINCTINWAEPVMVINFPHSSALVYLDGAGIFWVIAFMIFIQNKSGYFELGLRFDKAGLVEPLLLRNYD
jgi:hypothetical protein